LKVTEPELLLEATHTKYGLVRQVHSVWIGVSKKLLAASASPASFALSAKMYRCGSVC